MRLRAPAPAVKALGMQRALKGVVRCGTLIGTAMAFLVCSTLGTASRTAAADVHLSLKPLPATGGSKLFDLRSVGFDLWRPAHKDPLLQRFRQELLAIQSDTVDHLTAATPVLSAADAALYRQAFGLAATGDRAGLLTLMPTIQNKVLLGTVTGRFLLKADDKAGYGELTAWLTHYRHLPDAERIYAIALKRQTTGMVAPLPPLAPKPVRGNLAAQGRNGFVGAGIVAFPSDTTVSDQAALGPGSWNTGLQAWRDSNFAVAADAFAAAAATPGLAAGDAAAAHFWHGRALRQLGVKSAATTAWRKAAAYPHSFYGQLARARLGLKDTYRWDVPAFSANGLDALAAIPAGRRALALLQVDERAAAEAELRRIALRDLTQEMRQTVLGLAEHYRLPVLAMQLGSLIKHPDGELVSAALYPLPPWQAENSDEALIYAVMRQESGFNPLVVSRAGARGLMQIMPETARYLDAAAAPHALVEPALNLKLATRYIDKLAAMPGIKHDPLRLLAAYNAGPGNLLRWQQDLSHQDDPLLFIESLPARETRHYVQGVLSNYWIYQSRLGVKRPTLTQLAQGQWPKLPVPPALELTAATPAATLHLASK